MAKKKHIPDPTIQLEAIKKIKAKYKLGEGGMSFYDIRDFKPVFAFDYLSLEYSNLCYNCDTLTAGDYIGLLTALKTNSQLSYHDLRTNKYYRFHPINFDEDNISIKRKDFKKIFSFKPDEIQDDELPTLYQFDLHYHQKARACGFLYRGVFYLVWFDRNHTIYSGSK